MKHAKLLFLFLICFSGCEKKWAYMDYEAKDTLMISRLEGRGWQVVAANNERVYFKRDHEATRQESIEDSDYDIKKMNDSVIESRRAGRDILKPWPTP